MTDSPSTVLCEVGADGVGRLVLNRPEAMNAITTTLAVELRDALQALARDARVVLITGAGKHFCVGGDFKALQEIQHDRAALRELFESFHAACSSIARLPVPVIAAVHGYAMAGGFELMQACDIALVATDATLADNHSNFGQIPGGGGSQRLPRLVGRQRGLAHILTGERLTGQDAVDWGLAYRAVPATALHDDALALARRLAAKSPEALAGIKALVCEGLELPLDTALQMEVDAVVEHIAAADLTAFSKKTGD